MATKLSIEDKKLHQCITCRKLNSAYMMMQLCDLYKIKECIKCFNSGGKHELKKARTIR